jgi:hypothetical protein
MEPHSEKLAFTVTEFETVRSNAEALYKSIGSVFCPYFKEKVNFNVEGLGHIKFKAWNKARSQRDQFMRLKLIRLAPEILKDSKTLQGIWETQLPIRRKRHGHWEKVFTPVAYYEFIAVLEGRRVKVIVKQIQGGEKFFWTMIPFWRMDKFNRRILHSGNPELD